ncbi:MAG: hypothetical protein WD894_13880 [Pirellulales bacterium]
MPDDNELDEQIRQCVLHCLEDIDPRTCVRSFVSRLVLLHGWAQPDANLVADRALKFIARVSGDDSNVDA